MDTLPHSICLYSLGFGAHERALEAVGASTRPPRRAPGPLVGPRAHELPMSQRG